MTTPSRRSSAVLCALLAGVGAGTSLRAQVAPETLERLRRDQDEILRKAEHLQALMQRLLQRYEREGKEEKKLLQEGLAHLEHSGILRDVASIRDDLAATAFTEALRKQREVVDELERLLNILLERKSVENLDQQMQQTAQQAASARDLERRQQELQRQTTSALQHQPTPAEQAMLDQLQKLQRAEREEAQRNRTDAGTRRPALENALERVQDLLQRQDRLDKALDDETKGAREQARARQFDLGSLVQRARELAGQVKGQAGENELQQAAQAMQREAQGNDQQALQQARDRLERLVQDAPKLPGGTEGPVRDPRWGELQKQLQQAPAGATPAEREKLQQLAASAAELAEQRSKEAATRNGADGDKLRQDAKKLAETLAKDPPTDPNEAPARSLDAAAENLQQAAEAARKGDTPTAQTQLEQALSALENARRQDQQQHPDAEQQAGRMAADSQSTAQDLQNAPSAGAEEQRAAEQLQQAAGALRKAEEEVGKARDANRAPSAGEPQKTARQQLEQARDTLQQALGAATQDRGAEMQAAAKRQQELGAQASATREAMQQQATQGQLDAERAKAAAEQLQKAEQAMQDAAQKLQQGQQASAAERQQDAADALQRAGEQMQKGGQTTPEQKQAMQQQAEQQQKLAEDIVRLAKELQQRDNAAAKRDVEQAADAAQKAKRALEQGDGEEAEQQQEQARRKLDEAAKELEEERDRYQDLRQEELLFKMKEELTNFLGKQRPITAQTLEAQQQADKEALSRPMRRKLNQLGEEEQELSGRIEFLVNALGEEGNLVYRTVLSANLDDLREVARRLAGRSPDPSRFTTLLQQDVEHRSEELLKALEREHQRREQERKDEQERKRKEQSEQAKKSKNRFDPKRQKLVGLIAELEMLKQLEQDTARAVDDQRKLIEARGDDTVSEAEAALVERLSHRHGEITKLFAQIKAGIEAAMQPPQSEGEDPNDPHQGQKKGK